MSIIPGGYWRKAHKCAVESTFHRIGGTGWIGAQVLTFLGIWAMVSLKDREADMIDWVPVLIPVGLLSFIYVFNLFFRAPAILHRRDLENINLIEKQRNEARKDSKRQEEEIQTLRAKGANTDWIEHGSFSFEHDYLEQMNEREAPIVVNGRFKKSHGINFDVHFNQTKGVNKGTFAVTRKHADGFEASVEMLDTFYESGIQRIEGTWQAVGKS